MTSALTVDVLRLVTDCVRTDPAVAEVLGGRVFTVLPKDKVFPLCRITRWGGTFVQPYPAWLEQADLQIDVWADRQAQASDAARCLVETLLWRLPGSRPGGVVTAARITTIAAELDPDYEPVKHRARLGASVFAHP